MSVGYCERLPRWNVASGAQARFAPSYAWREATSAIPSWGMRPTSDHYLGLSFYAVRRRFDPCVLSLFTAPYGNRSAYIYLSIAGDFPQTEPRYRLDCPPWFPAGWRIRQRVAGLRFGELFGSELRVWWSLGSRPPISPAFARLLLRSGKRNAPSAIAVGGIIGHAK